MQAGMSSGLTARWAWRENKRTTLLGSAKVSLVGAYQVELGARYRWGRLTSTGLAVVYGSQVPPYALPSGCPPPSPLPCPSSALYLALWCDLCPALCPALLCPAMALCLTLCHDLYPVFHAQL